MNVKIKRQIQHLWFIEELLQKILTIGERCFSWKTSQPGTCRIRVEESYYRSYSRPPCCDSSGFTSLWNMKWNQMKIYIKAFTLKAVVKICSFSKARDIVEKFWVSETTQKKSLQKHLKSVICWKQVCEKVMHIIQLSHVLLVKLSRFFFYSNTHWLLSCRFSSSWTPRQYLFMPHKF